MIAEITTGGGGDSRCLQTRNPSEKGLQFRILDCTVVQYNKTFIDLIFG
jgi:hypothetical protein